MKTLRAIGAITATLAVVTLSSGCTTSDEAPIPGATATANTSAAPATSTDAPTPSASRSLGPTASATQSEAPFTGAAADKFGADNVMAAYHFAISTLQAGLANDSLLALQNPRVIDFSYMDDFVTQQVLDQIHPAEARVAAGTATNADYELLVGLVAWDLKDSFNGATVGYPASRNFVYGGATTYVSENAAAQPVLVVKFPINLQYLVTADGKPVYYQVSRDVTVGMVETGDKAQPWKIDSYSFTQDVKGPSRQGLTETAAGSFSR